MQDGSSDIKVTKALAVTAISSDTTTNGTTIDLQGYDSCTFVLQSGTLTDGAYAPTITEGDESDLSDGATAAAASLIGTAAGASFAASDDGVAKKLGYKGSKRYVRLNIVSTSTTSGGTLNAVAILGKPKLAPVAQ